MTPEELAPELGISAKTLRAWLRRASPRSPAEKYQPWHLDSLMVEAVRAHFAVTARSQSSTGASEQSQAAGGIEIADATGLFVAAPPRTRTEILGSPSPVPSAPGVYGWWFRRLPARIDTSQCIERDGLTLLYVGISPRRPPANGSPPSGQTLRNRLKTHCAGDAAGSTLRKTLGCLLNDELDIRLQRVRSGNRMTFAEGEQVLSRWMGAHALVSWIVHSEPWELEETLIANLDLPLNLAGNTHNRFHPKLSAARASAISLARELPIVG